MKYKDLVFDLDGTLFDTIPDIVDAINELLSIKNIDLRYDRESAKKLIGSGPVELLKRAHPSFINCIDEVYKDYLPIYNKHSNVKVAPFEGIRELLIKAKEIGHKIYVATNKPQESAVGILTKFFGLDFFDGVLGYERNDFKKPSKEFGDYFLNKFNLKTEDILYVGDSIVDLEFSKNNNFDSCLVLWGYGDYKNLNIEPKYKISQPSALLSII